MIKDPYGIKNSNNNNNLNIFYVRKDLCYTAINFTKNNKYDYVIIGGSLINQIIETYLVKDNKKIAKLTLPEISIIEIYNLLSYYLKFHPETKNIIVSLEFPCYSYCNEGYSIPLKPTNKLNDFIKIYYSLDSTKKSLNSIFDSLNSYIVRNKQQNNNQKNKDFIPYNDKTRYTYDNICVYDGINGFKKVYRLINHYKLNAYYVLPPTNALFLADLYKQGYYADLEKFKKEIAQITPYYDMAFINHYTKKPIKYIFADVLHVNHMFLGKKFLNTILNHNIDKDFVTYITKENVNNILTEQKKILLNYIQENETTINNYLNINPQYRYKKKYISVINMPEEETKLYKYNFQK